MNTLPPVTWGRVQIIVLSALFLLPPVGQALGTPAGRQLRSAVTSHSGSHTRSCPSGAKPHNVNSAGWAWIGSGPVQAVSAWSGQQGVLSVGPWQTHGFPQKVLWLVGRGLRQDVTLRGWNLRTGQRVWFGFADQGPYRDIPERPVGILHYRYPSAMSTNPSLTRRWLGYSSGILVPAFGCYVLYAQWRSGGWIVPFAVGG